MTRNFNPVINTFNGILRPFVYANFWVAGAVWALTRLTEFQTTNWWEPESGSLASFNAAATLVFYGFARLFESPSPEGLQSKISKWREAMPRTSQLSMALGVAFMFVYWLFFGSWKLAGLYAAGLLIAALYPLPFILSRKGGGLRSIPGLKLFLIAGIWAYVTAGIPGIMAGNFSFEAVLERFFWTAALTLPFDVRDMQVDAGSIKTIPHYIGQRTTLTMANFFLWLSFFFQVYYLEMPLATMFGLYVLFSTILLMTNTKFGDLYYSFLIEGLPFLLLGAWYLFA